MYFILCNFCLL